MILGALAILLASINIAGGFLVTQRMLKMFVDRPQMAQMTPNRSSMPETLVTIAYLAAGLLFIFSLAGLSKQESASRGNLFGMLGMLIAVMVTAFGPRVESYSVMTGALVIGGAIGALMASRVEMTSMPQLVAILHSFVGAAAVLVGIATAMNHTQVLGGVEARIHEIEIFIGVFVGAVTFTGSVIAYGKLQGLIGSKPLLLPGRHLLNLIAILGSLYLGSLVRLSRQLLRAGVAALRRDFHRVPARHPPGDGDRRRRHAGRGVDAQQLFGMGGGGGGLHARERPADHHRRAGRIERRDPQLHHVSRDEPIVPERDSRRLRRGRRRGPGRRLGAAGRRSEVGDGRRDRGFPARREERDHRARLRHGSGAGAVSAVTKSPSCCATRAPTSGSRSIRWPAACPGT